MKPDDILFAPLAAWRQTCRDITQWIVQHRDPLRLKLVVYRPRPHGALLLHEMAEAFHEHGQRRFWRTEYPCMISEEFEFDGTLKPSDPSNNLMFPVFGQVGHNYYRSIEDANLVPNTYTHYYIFRSRTEAILGLSFLTFNYP